MRFADTAQTCLAALAVVVTVAAPLYASLPRGYADARGRTTFYDNDAVGRRVRTLYPSGRTESDALDALGRRVAFTNSEGRVYRMS